MSEQVDNHCNEPLTWVDCTKHGQDVAPCYRATCQVCDYSEADCEEESNSNIAAGNCQECNNYSEELKSDTCPACMQEEINDERAELDSLRYQ